MLNCTKVWRFVLKQEIDRKNEQTATILKMQGAQLAEIEALYKEEQIMRKRYFNMIEGTIDTLAMHGRCLLFEW